MHALKCAIATVAVAAVMPAAAIADSDHGMTMPGSTHVAKKAMSVKAKVSKDSMKGYNLKLSAKGFRWAPQHAGMAFRAGEGHAHLYVDGAKVTRLYGPWFYLGTLSAGAHTIKVTLNGNDHGDFVNRNGKAVESTVRVTVPAS